MHVPPWLQELRDLLAVTRYDGRQEALMRWEQRWLVELEARQLLDPDLIIQSARLNLIGHAEEYVQRHLGIELGQLMVEMYRLCSHERSWAGEPMLEVRGTVVAIRREPKSDV